MVASDATEACSAAVARLVAPCPRLGHASSGVEFDKELDKSRNANANLFVRGSAFVLWP